MLKFIGAQFRHGKCFLRTSPKLPGKCCFLRRNLSKENFTGEEKTIVRLNVAFRKLLLLAPAAFVYGSTGRVTINPERHEHLLRQLQCLRGAVYLEDGAITPKQLTNGRHIESRDRQSWHLLVVNENDDVLGCARYCEHTPDVQFGELAAAEASLARCRTWGAKTRAAIEKELGLARDMDLPFVEVGGWALDREIRGGIEALRLSLGTYALARELGGGVGLATATTRHSSSSILRKLGGQSLRYGNEEVPPYDDEHYKCRMELLRFYSWAPNPRYDVWIEEIRAEMSDIPVVCASSDALLELSSGVNVRQPQRFALAS